MDSDSCLLCGSKDVECWPVKGQLYHHCGICDLIQLDQAHYLGLATERHRYEEHNNTVANHGYVALLTTFIKEAVLPFSQRGTAVLDYGCGPGPVLQHLLQDRGFSVDIYDPIFFPDQPTRTYSLITCTEAIEHAYHPRRTWDHMISLVCPGGHISIMTLFHPQNEVGFKTWWYQRDPTHVSFYSKKTFEWVASTPSLSLQTVFTNGRNMAVMQKR